ncbi:MAG TPA: acyltransferase family protein [Candidatus Nanopelagicaceae bacterium]|nr:acyltransferase family protein [Candidatus Nanopelagicaceae bacterium]
MKLTHRSGYLPSLDGLRALAIVGVVIYHLNFSWLPGGFLGVDLFFAISGYVITWLLLDEIRATNSINLRAFFMARVRRLLPALLTLCLATAILAGIWAQDSVKRFLIDTPFTLIGLSNWHMVANQQNYFEEIGRPPLLQHTWSLAVEAQFYAIWPLAILLVWKYLDSKRIRLLALSAAAASTAGLLALGSNLAHASSTTVSHLYFGTDVHCVSLFLGAALAIAWVPKNLSADISWSARNFIDFMGFSAFVGIIAMYLFASETNVDLYRVAFPLMGLLAAIMIASLAHPASRLAVLFSNPVFRWIGTHSYGIYLWHWVIFQVTRPGVDVSGSFASSVFRTAVVLVVAEISYRFIEVPVRQGKLREYFARQKTTTVRKRVLATAGLAAAIGAVLGVAITVDANAITSHAKAESELLGQLKSDSALTIPRTDSSLPPDLTATDPSASPTPAPQTIRVIGDSVLLGAKERLLEELPISAFNAQVGRQADAVLQVLNDSKASALTADVIVDLGTNSPLEPNVVEQIFQALSEHPHAIVINTRVPRAWQDYNNKVLAQMAQKYPQVQLIDWFSAAKDHRDYFVSDGVHLTSRGITAYVGLIRQALNADQP